MSGSGRKRSSKWDSRDQFDDEHIQDDGWSEKASRSFYHREAGHGWQSPEPAGCNGSKHDAVFSSREPFSGSRGSHKTEKFDKEHNRYVEDSMVWDGDEDYGTRMSPGLDVWRQQSHSQSPKSGWNRRDRSRSRSRSRGRSRSPAHSLRRDSGFLDRSRSRSGVSNQVCKDFTAGRCRRGNNCSFLHDADENYDDYWDSRHRKGGSSKYSTDTRDYASRRPSVPCNDFVKGRCRRGASCRFEHHGASDEFGKANDGSREKENDRRKRDTSMERVVEHEFRRSSDIPCKFFAAGNCRNGKHCRFSHHARGYSSPDRKAQDKWSMGRKSDDVNQAWGGPKWNDDKINGDIDEKNGALDPNSANWSMDDRLRNSVNNESIIIADSTVSCEATKSNDKEALQWKTDGPGVSMSLPRSRHGEKWIEDMDMSPDWNYSVPSSNQIPRRSESFKDVSLKKTKHGATEEDSSRFNGAVAVVQPMVSAIPFLQEKPDLRDGIANVLPYEDKSSVRKAMSSHTDQNISGNITLSQSAVPNGQNASVFHFSSMSAVEQSQMAIPTEPQGVILGKLQNNVLSLEGKSVVKPDLEDGKMPQVNSGVSLPQKLSSSDQLHLKNLSDSLVQLLGNGQQLPQLYAALNSNNTANPSFADAEGSGFPVSSSITLPDLAIGLNSMIPNPVMKTTVPDIKPEIQLKTLIPSSLPSLPDGTDGQQPDGSLEDSKQKTQSLISPKPNASSEVEKGKNELGPVENKKVQEENKKVQETALDGVEKDAAIDGKKNKDVKGLRAFKFALVEFVKELLKPSWKDGQINKDIYKTIVKKVVDKVTATMQGASIPQTQEKIDHYLSNSKEKLTKLVQAYVDKNQKP